MYFDTRIIKYQINLSDVETAKTLHMTKAKKLQLNKSKLLLSWSTSK